MSKLGLAGVRIYGVAALTAVAALLLGLVLLQSSARSQDAFNWVKHTQEVIINLDGVESRLSQAESRLRGYLMSRDTSYLAGFSGDLIEADAFVARLGALVLDNPAQKARAARLTRLTAEKSRVMARAAHRMQLSAPDSLPDAAERRRGRLLMTAVMREVSAMRNAERRLLALRTSEAQTEVREVRALLLYGLPLLALLIGGIAWLIRTSISKPLADLLDVVTRFGTGDRAARASTVGRSAEFRRLAAAYNDMADHLVRAIDTQDARQHSNQLLSEMAQRLQAIQHDGELAEVLECFMPQLLADVAGAVYVHNHSRNMLLRVACWGNPETTPEMFPPDHCWGLRRGQSHVVANPGADLACVHAARSSIERRCEPLLAGGEVLGLIYVEGALIEENGFRLGVLMKNVALALVNDNLRSRLREQSIRDPLTTLFNRRYMEEALALETSRAERNGTPLSIVMCDVDHFKRFNDGHGHEAGDLLLAAVAALIQTHFRQGDVVCRYGGEEFTVIAPGASAILIHQRAEALRLAVREMTVEHHGRRLGPVTMSFGIDTWSAVGDRPLQTLLGEADRALFRAKRHGRDRVEFAAEAQPLETTRQDSSTSASLARTA
ncbi:diguanylate cyclase [Sphingomonas prati]|uniref:diguanylate cyclase n=1 Tax=Sphingomonas prati TaxID=1843237 RepID=A0A7W9BSF9_9SPHN|nr:diguanylate cyclase [Sphingomonas prati]MBB5729322.1 diguanylate cyclase (GGDEF)-like protein [Sphingomonas prati]GGE78362.1 sensor histidine kinase [Sphingomonas prati]